MTVCSEVMSDDWPYESGIDVQHIRNFFFLSHQSWWWERLEMPLTCLISTPFLLSRWPKISLHVAPVWRQSSHFLFMNGNAPIVLSFGSQVLTVAILTGGYIVCLGEILLYVLHKYWSMRKSRKFIRIL